MSRKIFGKSENEFIVTAFVGKDGDPSIQFNIGSGLDSKFTTLTGKEVKKLRKVLKKRLKRKKGFTAT